MDNKKVKIIAGTVGVGLAIALTAWWMTTGTADEAWAIQTLRTINGAQVAYFDRCDGYAPSLIELRRGGDLPSSDVTAEGTIVDSGYRIAVVPSTTAAVVSNDADGCGDGVTDYVARAAPVKSGRASRHYATDSSGTIVHDAEPIGNPIPARAKPILDSGHN